MTSYARLDWRGDALIHRVRDAARAAVNETVDEAAADARETHTWKPDPRIRHHKRTGHPYDSDLELHIKSRHARRAQPNPTGSFGYTKRKGFYGLFHEEGTVHEHQYPALRPAADRQFPTLASRIRAKLIVGLIRSNQRLQ